MISPDAWIDRYFALHPVSRPALIELGNSLNKLGLGVTSGFLCLLFLLLGYLAGRPRWIKGAWGAILTMSLSGILVQILKHLVGRARPQMNLGAFHFIGPNLHKNGLDSFPSGHAFSTFAAATFLSAFWPGASVPLYLTAAAVSLFGRVAFRHHFLSDALAGAGLGLLLGWYCAKGMRDWIESEKPATAAPTPLSAAAAGPRRNLWIVVAFSAVILFAGLGKSALWDRDETEYAQAVLEMQHNHAWLIPTLEGETFIEKPILMYWFVRPSCLLWGFNEFSARLPSALFGVLTCAATYYLGEALWAGSGLYAGLVLATSFLFVGLFRMLMTDPFFVFFNLLALLFYVYARKNKEHAARFWTASALSSGLAFLTKGPIALFPVAIFLVFEWMADFASCKDFLRRNVARLALYALTATAVALPWFLYVFNAQKGATENFFLYENISRFLRGSEGHNGPLFYYVPALLLGFFPWSFFLIPSVQRAWAERKRRGAFEPGTLLLTLWALILFVFFSVCATKLPHYLLPAFPALACLVGKLWLDFAREGVEFPQAAFRITDAVGAALVLAPAALYVLRPAYASWRLIFPFLGFFLFLAASQVWARHREWEKSFVALCLGTLFLFLNVSGLALPWVERFRVMKPIGLDLAELPAEADVVGYEISEPSLFIYGHRVFPKLEKESLDSILRRPHPVYVVVQESDLKSAAVSAPYKVLDRRDGFAENQGETALLLLTNRT